MIPAPPPPPLSAEDLPLFIPPPPVYAGAAAAAGVLVAEGPPWNNLVLGIGVSCCWTIPLLTRREGGEGPERGESILRGAGDGATPRGRVPDEKAPPGIGAAEGTGRRGAGGGGAGGLWPKREPLASPAAGFEGPMVGLS